MPRLPSQCRHGEGWLASSESEAATQLLDGVVALKSPLSIPPFLSLSFFLSLFVRNSEVKFL
jgi:hypothetical protein